MSDGRPYNERPAARPAAQSLPPMAGGSSFGPPKKRRIGFLGVLLMAAGATLVVIVLANVIAAISQPNEASQSGDSGTTSGGTSSIETADPIEQARVVLGGVHSYATVKQVTDAALSATGTALTDDSRSRAWSSVLSVTNNMNYDVDPMEVMQCVPGLGEAAAGSLDFPDAAALCATEIALSY